MRIIVKNEAPFQILTSAMSIGPSPTGYQLEVSADGKNFSPLFSVAANTTKMATGLAPSSYYRLKNNVGDVVVNWSTSCVIDGGGGGDMSNYYTKAETDAAITAATEDMATEADITASTASETARTENTYAKISALDAKLDTSAYTSYTASTEGKEEVIASALTSLHDTKQDNLVSGENIKTINNQSLLGSGNITIQGGGGGSVVELTQQEYDALVNPDSGTTYIITDAPVVDLNDYAMASGLTELSGTVQTINSNYATKQNVTARASNSNYLPGWNAQGVITGSTAYYNKSQGINGQNYNVFSSSNTNHPAIFAPTSAGTAGQPLLSNGSGAPVWGGYKFAFITQTAYDALTTKDATTIYFIVG